MVHEPIDVGLIGGTDAEWRLKIFASEGEAVRAVMRGSNDDE
jgi:hypothetical protein